MELISIQLASIHLTLFVFKVRSQFWLAWTVHIDRKYLLISKYEFDCSKRNVGRSTLFFMDWDGSSNLKLYHTSLDTFEVKCRGLLTSKLDIRRSLFSREAAFYLGEEWCCQCIAITLFSYSGHIASSVYLHASHNTIELLTHLARVEREGPKPTN